MRQWLSHCEVMLQSSQNERSSTMKTIKAEPLEERTKEPAGEESPDNTEKSTVTSLHSNILAQQFTADEGGVPTDMYCPACREEIFGTYLPIFECPHCEVKIWRDDKVISQAMSKSIPVLNVVILSENGLMTRRANSPGLSAISSRRRKEYFWDSTA